MLQVQNLIYKVPKVVWVCLISTLAITFVQASFSYFFEYESIKIYTKFYRFIGVIFFINLMVSSIIFCVGKKIYLSIVTQVIFFIGMFAVFLIKNYYYSVYFSCIYDLMNFTWIGIGIILILLITIILIMFNFKKNGYFFIFFTLLTFFLLLNSLGKKLLK